MIEPASLNQTKSRLRMPGVFRDKPTTRQEFASMPGHPAQRI